MNDENLFFQFDFENMTAKFRDGPLLYFKLDDGRWVEVFEQNAWDISGTMQAEKMELALIFRKVQHDFDTELRAIEKQMYWMDKIFYHILIVSNKAATAVLHVLKKVLK